MEKSKAQQQWEKLLSESSDTKVAMIESDIDAAIAVKFPFLGTPEKDILIDCPFSQSQN